VLTRILHRCKNLVEKGSLDKPLILYNRTKSRSEDLSSKLESSKTKVVDTISDAVKSSDIIFMCLGDDAAVNSTIDEILKGDVKGKLIVDCSTVHPDTTNALEKKVTEKGAEFVGMPGKSSHLYPPLLIPPSHTYTP
jgi:3-hydroxyisobutyrate dehydrogenase-like beta-hydroxyacid dehydrogenase